MNRQTAIVATCDKDLVEGINLKSGEAFILLYQEYWQDLLDFATKYVQDISTCEELVQDLFVQLYEKRFQLDISISLSSYLKTALKNRILNHLRKQAIYKKHLTASCLRKGTHPDNLEGSIHVVLLEERIYAFVNRMPEKYRDVYLLRNSHHLPLKRIAKILQRPIDTVDKQLRKALSLLREFLKPERLNVFLFLVLAAISLKIF